MNRETVVDGAIIHHHRFNSITAILPRVPGQGEHESIPIEFDLVTVVFVYVLRCYGLRLSQIVFIQNQYHNINQTKKNRNQNSKQKQNKNSSN